jgi:hypothetical protein
MWLSLTRRRVPAALSLCLFLYKADAATEAGWLPDRLTIDKIEAALGMPEGAAPLSAYRRRYGGVIEAGRRVIWGLFLLSTIAPDDAAITILDHRPLSLLADGGCLVVTTKFDVDLDRLLWIRCNGQA